jgi:thiamine-monophosphate kinase
MMDLSDGLAKDLQALTPRGNRAALVEARLPRRRGVGTAAALTDGEDYELVFALDAKTDRAVFARAWDRAFPRTPVTEIGAFVAADRKVPGTLDLSAYQGYEHLR